MIKLNDIPRGVPPSELRDVLTPEALDSVRDASRKLPQDGEDRAEQLLVLSLCYEALGPEASGAESPRGHLEAVSAVCSAADFVLGSLGGSADLRTDAFRMANMAAIRLAASDAAASFCGPAFRFVAEAMPERLNEDGPVSDPVALSLALDAARAAVVGIMVRGLLLQGPSPDPESNGAEESLRLILGLVRVILANGTGIGDAQRKRAEDTYESLKGIEAMVGVIASIGRNSRL